MTGDGDGDDGDDDTCQEHERRIKLIGEVVVLQTRKCDPIGLARCRQIPHRPRYGSGP
jgi:hypothetical protein